MRSLIAVHPTFESHWPFVADLLRNQWEAESPVEFIRAAKDESRSLGHLVTHPAQIERCISLGVPVTLACLEALPALREASLFSAYGPMQLTPECQAHLQAKAITHYQQRSEGFWGESVAEFALGLTICALRQIPQRSHQMLTSHEAWSFYSPTHNQGPNQIGSQMSDDLRFTSGTIAGKRVRIIGAGNIGSRYASFVHMLGADVATWDPFASEPGFHRSGARRQHHLDQLLLDAEIFAPMVPLTPQTRGLVTAELIDSLPTGCLVILATRALICDMQAIRRRVYADEIALAADVFDVEPLPLDDPLLGRHNVVHTPHLAGRTLDANRQWASELLTQFRPFK